MKPSHLRQKSGSHSVFLPLPHHPFHIDHEVLPTSLPNITKTPPLFSILTPPDYTSFSLGSSETLLRLHPLSFLSPTPATRYILAQWDDSKLEYDHRLPFRVH